MSLTSVELKVGKTMSHYIITLNLKHKKYHIINKKKQSELLCLEFQFAL